MLGERTGTGYTEGAPYLKAVQTIPVFLSLATGLDAGDAAADLAGRDEIAPAPTPAVIPPRGRCPFASRSTLPRLMAAAAGA